MTAMEQIGSIYRDLLRDQKIFTDHGYQADIGYYDERAIISYKVLFGFTLCILKQKDEKAYREILSRLSDYQFDRIVFDKEIEDNLLAFDADLSSNNDRIINLLEIYGWKTMMFSNYAISQGEVDISHMYPKNVTDFINPYIEAIYSDTIKSDGMMDFYVMQNQKLGYYQTYLKAYPKQKIKELHEAIMYANAFVKVPMYYYEGELHGEYVSQEGIYYSTYAVGYCGGYERYSNANVISPGCLSMACYLNQLLLLAEELMPGYKEFCELMKGKNDG